MDWFLASPTAVSFAFFDTDSYKVASGALFTEQTYKLLDFTFVAKPAQIHLFVIALFIALIAPFAGFFVAGLKRALRAEQLGLSFQKGGVIDRLDCVIVTGFFLFIYIKNIVYDQQTAYQRIQGMISNLSTDAQVELYNKMVAELGLPN